MVDEWEARSEKVSSSRQMAKQCLRARVLSSANVLVSSLSPTTATTLSDRKVESPGNHGHGGIRGKKATKKVAVCSLNAIALGKRASLKYLISERRKCVGAAAV